MIIVTGGAGFIGSCFLKKLNDNGISDILVVDHLGTGNKWKNLNGKHFEDFVRKDVFRQRLENGYYNNYKIESIIHLGACSATTEPDADYLMDNNYSYSKLIAKFAFERNIRFIYASSAATYGDGSFGYSDFEFDNLKPLNCYGLSKHLFDIWIIRNGFQNKATGIKFFNVFGPNEYHKANMISMVQKSFHQVLETGKVKLFKSYESNYNDGEQKRDFIYVKDVTEVMWKMLNNPEFTGIYNLGTGMALSWNDLANAVFKAMGRIPIIEYIDMPDNLVNQYQYYTQATMNKLMTKLDNFAFTSLEDSVADYVQNYLMKEDKYL